MVPYDISHFIFDWHLEDDMTIQVKILNLSWIIWIGSSVYKIEAYYYLEACSVLQIAAYIYVCVCVCVCIIF